MQRDPKRDSRMWRRRRRWWRMRWWKGVCGVIRNKQDQRHEINNNFLRSAAAKKCCCCFGADCCHRDAAALGGGWWCPGQSNGPTAAGRLRGKRRANTEVVPLCEYIANDSFISAVIIFCNFYCDFFMWPLLHRNNQPSSFIVHVVFLLFRSCNIKFACRRWAEWNRRRYRKFAKGIEVIWRIE